MSCMEQKRVPTAYQTQMRFSYEQVIQAMCDRAQDFVRERFYRLTSI